MASKAGVLDNPSLYDAPRSKAVYARPSGGFFFLLDGVRVTISGTQRWTTNDGVAMRGAVPHVPLAGEAPIAPPAQALDAIEEEELAMAIAASLADGGGGEQDVAMPEAAPDGVPAAVGAGGGVAPPPAEPRRCVVCLDDDAPVDHMVAPCHHLCLCAGCAARVRRQRMACPVCRHAQRGIVRVFL